jgi:hypothetical protein
MSEFPRDVCPAHHSRGERGYTVEARCTLKHPKTVNGKALGGEWLQLEFPHGRGVPAAPPYSPLPLMGLLSYQAAQALRWWWIAEAEAADICSTNGIETRLVQFDVKVDWEARAVAAVDEQPHHFGASPRLPKSAPPSEQP